MTVLQTGLSVQNRLIHSWLASLQTTEPASFLIETHISWIVLSGNYAYKIKKALHYDFLDYSDLAIRRFYCQEEIRLNRRTASDIYLDVVQIGGSNELPCLNASPALEYAVKMRQFNINNQLDHLLEKSRLTVRHIDSLAEAIADFHLHLGAFPQAENSSHFGSPEILMHKLVENLHELKDMLTRPHDLRLWEELKQLQIAGFMTNRDRFEQREANGCIRECHGDMHMGNLVMIDGKVLPFDGIEFDPQYRWLDTINDVAFAFMDLLYYGKKPFAWRLLNHYLQRTGDYDGVALLRYYASYYAVVRAKVHLIRHLQKEDNDWSRIADNAEYRRYMILAIDLLKERQPGLVITMGLPGSGKTVFAQSAVEKLPAICLRSDIERKRLANDLMETYGEESKQKVYYFLLAAAASMTEAGMTVVIDASFIKADNRDLFHKMAEKRSIPFAIALVTSDSALMEERLAERSERNDDASDADVDVLMKLKDKWEPLTEAERTYAVEFVNKGNTGFEVPQSVWHMLNETLRIKTDRSL